MKRYKTFTTRDLLDDPDFIKWVKEPDEETNKFWDRVITNYPEKEREIREAHELLSLLDWEKNKLPEESFRSMRQRIGQSMAVEKVKKKGNGFFSTKEGSLTTVLKIAAVLTIPLLSFTYWVLSTNSDRESLDEAVIQPNNESKWNWAIDREHSNPRGQKSVITLPDGTKIWLNSDSKLRVPSNFAASKTREVYLDGEAYFDVAKNPSKPFVVHTLFVEVKVLGTAFNVKSYRDDSQIETTLIHGKVSIGKTGDTNGLVLLPNQKAIFSKKTSDMSVHAVANIDIPTAWRQNKLVFDGAPLADVILQLERWYDVKIHIESEGSLECLITANLDNESLTDVLQLFEISHKVTWRINGKDVFMEGTFCNKP